jgi:cereblon
VWGEVQIIEEDTPLRTPRDAFAQLASCHSFSLHYSSPDISLDMPLIKQGHIDSELERDTPSPCSDTSNHSSKDTRLCHQGASDSSQSLDEDKMRLNDVYLTSPKSSSTSRDTKRQQQYHGASSSKQAFEAPLSFWPRWAYEMYDSYTLAHRAAGREMLLFHQSYFIFLQFDDHNVFPCYS